LENIEFIHSLENFTIQQNWEFYLPLRVKNELNKPLNQELQNLIQSGTIKEDCANESFFRMLRNRFYNLGDGELDAIGLVDKCIDRTFNDYLILTDDNIAMRRANSLGMKSSGILPYIVMANRSGFVTRVQALNFLMILKNNRFIPSTTAERAFGLSLV